MANEAHKLLDDFLSKIQKNDKVRTGLAVAAVIGLLGIAASFLYDALPHKYALSISGGEILSSPHFIARVLQQEAAHNGVALRLLPTSGSQEALQKLDSGKLDLAFIQDGLTIEYPNIRHVAYIAPEQLQLLVRPTIKDIAGLHNKLINLGSRLGGTRLVAREVLEFSGLHDGVEYIETNFPTEELMNLADDRLPDAVMVCAFVPTDIAEFLVKQRGYTLLEIPFPASLALRVGWVANSKILAYTYNVTPPVPARDVTTVGVNMHLMANKNVDPRAVFRVLESLYGPEFQMRTSIKMNEGQLTTPSGYELSEGSKSFLERNDPLLSAKSLDSLKALFGVILSVGSTMLVVFRWFKGQEPAAPAPSTDDPIFIAWINEVVAIERQYEAGTLDPGQASVLQTQLSTIKTAALDKVGTAKLDNALLPQTLILAIADARVRIAQVGAS